MRTLLGAAIVCGLAAAAWAVDADLKKLASDPDSFKRSDAARKLGRDGSAGAAKLLLELIEDRNPYVRDHSVKACAGITEEAAVKQLLRGARTQDDLLRQNMAEALGRTRAPSALPVLRKLAVSDKRPRVQVQALDWLWGYRENAAALAICDEAYADKDPSVRAAAVEAAGRIRGDAALVLTRKALDDEDEGVRCVARMELRFLAREEALATLVETADAPGWRTRAQVVDDALALRETPAVDALLKLLTDECLRVAAAAHRALQALSGKEFGRDAEIWLAWWEQNRADWKPPQGQLEETAVPDDPKKTVARFHGIDVTSDRMVFVLDASGSMRDPMDKGTDDRRRWDVVREQLNETLAALPDGVHVNVIIFQEKAFEAFSKPKRLTRSVRRECDTFLKRTSPGEGGDLLTGMGAALDVEDVDTIFLLSDGAPSFGDMVDKTRVRSRIRSRNRRSKRAIHTIGFGSRKKTERSFMAGVAGDAGGRVVFR